MKKIAIFGSGYVGLSLAVTLAETNKVSLYDIDQDRLAIIEKGNMPFYDKDGDIFKKRFKKIILKNNLTSKPSYDYDYYFLCVPTNFNEEKGFFDTSILEDLTDDIIKNSDKSHIIIKSTCPIGFTETLNKRYETQRILFSPEFLREGFGISDSLKPSRIVIGGNNSASNDLLNLYKNSIGNNVKSILSSTSEAEAIKLFSNAYLSMRVAFFNELDSFAMAKKLNSRKIIEGISMDERIGFYHNNPSFGYGGYCLPKDTKQLKRQFTNIPQQLISATIDSNETRKQTIYKKILSLGYKKIGIYRLNTKMESDNFRESAVIQIISSLLKHSDIEMIVYEPNIKGNTYMGCKVVKEIEFLANFSEVIIANRLTNELKGLKCNIFTRDIFEIN